MKDMVQQFIEALKQDNSGVEAVVLATKDEILVEHYFTRLVSRNIYSHTKSYMSTAVGIAIDEGMMKLTDRLADYFPEYVPKEHQPELEEITLRDLLTMSSGFNHALLMGDDRRKGVGQPDYLHYMMNLPVEVQPGSRFEYSTADSHLAGMMVAKAVGKKLDVYLYEKMFQPMGMSYPIWESDPQGYSLGGGGMYMNIVDMMRIGQLYLAKGQWNGQQIVSEAWINEATKTQIENRKEENWTAGYGYQFWIMPQKNIYRADGAFGQISFIMPDQGYVLAIQCSEYGDIEKTKKKLLEHVFTKL